MYFFPIPAPPWRGSEKPFQGGEESMAICVSSFTSSSLSGSSTAPAFLVTMRPRALIQISVQSIEMLSVHVRAGENGRLPPYRLSPEVPIDFPPWQSTGIYIGPLPPSLQDIHQCMITIRYGSLTLYMFCASR